MRRKRILQATVSLLLALAAGTGWGLEWYRTSPTGIPGEPLAGDGPAPRGWTLSIDHGVDTETRSLYNDGELQGTTVFLRSEGRLMAREELDSEGALISRVEYAYDAEGNPRAVFIGTEPGSRRVTSDLRRNPDASVRRVSDGAAGDWRITDMDESGKPVRRVVLNDGSVSEETTWERDDEGDLREEIRRAGGDEIRGLYDDDGRLLEESVRRGGRIVLIRSYLWDGTNLIRVEERGEGRLVVRDMSWAGGRMTGEVRSVDGVTVSETEWPSAGEKIETLYRDGEAVIRVYWTDGVKRREEFLKGGEVVRVSEERG